MKSPRRPVSRSFKGWAAWLGLLALAVSIVILSRQWPARSAQTQKQAQSTTKMQTTASVQMNDLKFAPAALNVQVGTTVAWTNLDKASHDITIDSGPELFLSPEQKQGGTARFTFTKPGSYHYFCEFYPSM